MYSAALVAADVGHFGEAADVAEKNGDAAARAGEGGEFFGLEHRTVTTSGATTLLKTLRTRRRSACSKMTR